MDDVVGTVEGGLNKFEIAKVGKVPAEIVVEDIEDTVIEWVEVL